MFFTSLPKRRNVKTARNSCFPVRNVAQVLLQGRKKCPQTQVKSEIIFRLAPISTDFIRILKVYHNYGRQ